MSFQPGDSILFKRGDIWNGELSPSTSGNQTNYISYGAYSTGTNPIIHATGSYALNGNKNYIRYSDFILENGATAGFVTYSNYQELNNIVSRNNLFHGYMVRGNNNVFNNDIAENNSMWGYLGDGAGGDILNNFTATNNKDDGILFNGVNNITINNGESSYNGLYPTTEGNGIVFIQVNTATITNFHSHHNHGNGLGTIGGSSNIQVIGGEYNNMDRGHINLLASCIRFDTNTADSKVLYVKAHDCESAGVVLEDGANNNLIAYNLLYNNARGSSSANNPGINNKYYNNIFYNNTGSDRDSGGLVIFSPVAVTVKNNIFINNSKGMFFDYGGDILTHTIDYNLYFGNTVDIRFGSTSYSAAQVQNGQYYAATGYEQHGIGLNPLFVNPTSFDFHLQSNSNAKDKGTSVGLIRDYDNNIVPQGTNPDIGAFEFSQGANGCIDNDNDGYGNPGSSSCQNGNQTDCNDNDININSGAIEVCDGQDNNCVNGIDENPSALCNNNTYCGGIEICQGVNGCILGTPVNCNDNISCTSDSCNEALDICNNIPNNSLCNDNLYCNGVETCSITLGCIQESPIDCSSNNIPSINNTCFNNPDNDPYTLDTRQGFTSTCDENTDSCTIGNPPLTHSCSINQCTAECENNNNCNITECDLFDGCYNNIYRDYNDVVNTCLTNCSCTTNICNSYIQEQDNDNDGYSISCNDCNDNDININSGANEICGNNIDDNCNNLVDLNDPDCANQCIDNDGDNYGIGNDCLGPDCDDNNINVLSNITCNYNGNNCGNYQLCLLSCPTPPNEICGNNIDDNCNGPIDEGCTQQLQINLQQGYNFISVPFELTNNNINDVFVGIFNDLSRIYSFDSNWFVYRVNPNPSSTLNSIESLKGYIIIMNNPSTITLTGTIDTNKQRNLNQGWNLISINSLTSIVINTTLQDLDYTSIWKFDNNLQDYVQLNPSIDSLEPGKAYWIYLNNPGIFNS